MTNSEKFTYELCRQAFLPFWSYPNPIGKKGNELCDVLIVCDPYILIISVKEIKLQENTDKTTSFKRWINQAVMKSANQLFGAESYISKAKEITLKDKTSKVILPNLDRRVIFRIAVALGGEQKIRFPYGEFLPGKGFIHVFDSDSLFLTLKSLNTISDFTEYLLKKEDAISHKKLRAFSDSDFLAAYLIGSGIGYDDYSFEDRIPIGLWSQLESSSEYNEWLEEADLSYMWDSMIESMYRDFEKQTGSMSHHEYLNALNKISLETRVNRTYLANSYEDAIKKRVKARLIKPFEKNNHGYVLIPVTEENKNRIKDELSMRCHVARQKLDQDGVKVIIGIAIYSENNRMSYEYCYLEQDELDQEFVELAGLLESELGLFKNVQIGKLN